MATKVYLSGDKVIVDKVGNPVLSIPQYRAKFQYFGIAPIDSLDDYTDIKLLDTITLEAIEDNISQIQDQAGVFIGSNDDVLKYLENFIFISDSYIIPADIDVVAALDLDAAGSLTVAQKNILGNYVQDVNNLPYLLDRRQGGTGSQVYNQGEVSLSVSANNDYALSQSFQVHPYFAGKSQRVEMTFDNMGIEAGVIKKVGYFDSDRVAPYNTSLDGFYLEMDGTTYNIVIANANTGLEIRIPKANWDNQTDVLDLSKFSVMTMDFLYLGGSSVRFFFKIENKGFVLFHTYNHANVVNGTIVSSPNLPVRWEIRSTGGAGSFKQVCASVNSSGQRDLLTGTQLATPISPERVNANIVNTAYMLKAIRLDPTIGLDKALLTLGASAMATSNDNLFLDIRINPTIGGAPLTWINLQDENATNLGIQYANPDTTGNPSTTTITGGMIIWSSFMGDRIRNLASGGIGLNRKLGISLDGIPDVLTLNVIPASGGANADVYGTLNPTIN